MKKEMKKQLVSLGIILAVILVAFLALYKPTPVTNEEIVACIGEKATLYVQLGCHACESQEKIFGDNYNLINAIDCYYERDECLEMNIEATPTWIIGEEKIVGVQTIEELKELTEC